MLGGGEQALQVLHVLNDSSQSSYSAQSHGDVSRQEQAAEFAGEDAYEKFSSTVL